MCFLTNLEQLVHMRVPNSTIDHMYTLNASANSETRVRGGGPPGQPTPKKFQNCDFFECNHTLTPNQLRRRDDKTICFSLLKKIVRPMLPLKKLIILT